MSKQEEIREGIADIIMASWSKSEKSIDTAYDITAYLHSQGVVIMMRPEDIKKHNSLDDIDFYACEPLIDKDIDIENI